MPAIARQAGAVVIEINPEPTALTGMVSSYLIPGKAAEIMNRILSGLEMNR
jgi:NAD-dependent deacetylase